MPIMDAFSKYSRSLTSPPENGVNISPADDISIEQVTRALYVGGAGHLRVQMLGGEIVTLANVPAGSLMPLRVTHVFQTGTTATALVGFW